MSATDAVISLPAQVSPPEFALSALRPHAIHGVEVLALPVLPGGTGAAGDPPSVLLGPGGEELSDLLGTDLLAVLEQHGATGKAGEVVERVVLDTTGLTNADLRLVLLVGVGEGTHTELRRAGAALARHTKDRLSVATSLAALTDDTGLRALVEGLVLGSFEFHWRSDGPQAQPVGKVVLAGLVDSEARKVAVERALAVAGAGWLARTAAIA